MISDIDVWRAAQLLIKRHAADAGVVADELFDEGGLRRIASACQEEFGSEGVNAVLACKVRLAAQRIYEDEAARQSRADSKSR